MSISQSFEEFKATVSANQGKYNAFPISFTINADLDTPVSAYLKVTSPKSPSFLLESVEGGEKRGRYSYIGTDPFEVLKQDNTDPLVTLEARLKNIRCMPVPGLPNFSGGAVGYVSYDCVRHFESAVKLPEKDTIGLPESVFLFCASLLVFDHVKHTVIVISHAMLDDGDLTEVALRTGYDAAYNRISQLSSRLSQPLPANALRSVHAPLSQPLKTLPEMKSNVGKSGYEQMVDTLKVHIKKGDIFQAVPSQRVSVPLSSASAFDIYRQLRISNPSPYMFYFNFGDFEVLGASPEQLVKVENGKVTTHPIAGTRPRGKTPAEDEALATELLANEKERAEHIMLVDLGRNDVGRVSQPGTVQVDSLMQIERYSHVMHIVSHVSGQLAQDKTPYDALRAVFPAGTLSGAPKIRAMQLIAGLEQQKRCIYGGAVGYVSFSGVLDVAIAIRTMVVKGGVAHLQAGGGVVYDSTAAEEYQESINKMMALYKAIERAEQVSAHFSESKDVAVSAREAPANYERDIVMKNYALPVSELSGTFGRFGGRYVPETLVGALEDLEREYIRVLNDAAFKEELRTLQKYYVGRPTPMYFAKRLTDHIGGPRIWLKREDLAHTGAHKINNALGQALVAKRMGKQRIIAETGAGQHGVATATACALLGLDCVVYMGAEDIGRQSLNVFRMKMLGAKVVPVTSGSRTLKDAVNEAMRDWVTNVRDTYYLIGSSIGPHPFPTIVRDFQCCIGEEVRAQMLERAGRLPDVAVACVGGGSNAIGLFHPLIGDKDVKLVGVEAGGEGVSSGKHAATIVGGTPGVLHGTRTFLLQDNNGQITETHSISAGLDYPGVGPEHAWLADTKRVQYVPVTDKEALEGLQIMTKFEGIIPALEPSHAIYAALQIAKTMSKDQDLLINLCGRGDKDMIQVAAALNVNLHS